MKKSIVNGLSRELSASAYNFYSNSDFKVWKEGERYFCEIDDTYYDSIEELNAAFEDYAEELGF